MNDIKFDCSYSHLMVAHKQQLIYQDLVIQPRRGRLEHQLSFNLQQIQWCRFLGKFLILTNNKIFSTTWTPTFYAEKLVCFQTIRKPMMANTGTLIFIIGLETRDINRYRLSSLNNQINCDKDGDGLVGLSSDYTHISSILVTACCTCLVLNVSKIISYRIQDVILICDFDLRSIREIFRDGFDVFAEISVSVNHFLIITTDHQTAERKWRLCHTNGMVDNNEVIWISSPALKVKGAYSTAFCKAVFNDSQTGIDIQRSEVEPVPVTGRSGLARYRSGFQTGRSAGRPASYR